MKRKRHSPAVKAAIIARQSGLCARTGAPLVAGQIQFDHVLPIALGGADDESNLEALACGAHKAKTKIDIGRIRKADRQRKKASRDAIRKPKRAWPARSLKSPGFKGWRKFDGTPVTAP